MVDKITEASLLYDFYGQLLTEKQQRVMELYHEENFSLSEIATEFGITRAAVYDALKKAERALNQYEIKLGLVNKFIASNQAFDSIETKLDNIIKDNENQTILVKQLREVKAIISQLED